MLFVILVYYFFDLVTFYLYSTFNKLKKLSHKVAWQYFKCRIKVINVTLIFNKQAMGHGVEEKPPETS